MIRDPSGDDIASFAVCLTAVDLTVLSRLIVKAMLDEPMEYRLLDGFLHLPIELVSFDRIEVRGHARSLDQSAQRKIAHARLLQRTIDP